jgi:cytochrome c-type biogenesis protein CcmH/NrfG
MARVMRNLGKPEQAVIYIKRALKRDGGSAYGWWLLGLTESQSENEQAAGPALRKAVKLDPQSMQFLLSLAEHEYRANKFKKAGLLYEQALRLDAKSVKAWLNLAKTRKAMNDPRALEAIQEALRLQPQNRRALRWQAELKKASGRK